MFIKKLVISNEGDIVREINFHKGINLIVDETPSTEEKLTGNNVGKTTVLKLIDFCLGGKATSIYSDTENKKEKYETVKQYLIEKKTLITLVLVRSLEDTTAEEIVIERNFLSRNKIIRRINGIQYTEEEFESTLLKLIFPQHNVEKPTFRQIISHNIRYKDESINKTLKTLDKFTTDVEYETLYLYLLGCTFNDGAKKQAILTKIKQEDTYRERLEKNQTKVAYEVALSMIEDEISKLNIKKANFNLNENFEEELMQLNEVKRKINKISSSVSNLEIRKNLIEEAKREIASSISNIDLRQLEVIYSQAVSNIEGIQKTFDDLVHYHNNMLKEKMKFIGAELPMLLQKIQTQKEELKDLLIQEKKLGQSIAKGDSFEELEKVIAELNEKYRLKGEYESIIAQLDEVEANTEKFKKELKEIEDSLFSDEFEEKLKVQLTKFNRYFYSISEQLYGEKYALKYDKTINKKGQQLYKFNAFNANMSSGKKQGEILCFDLAYIMFADEEKIPCLHFLLNDKKELMHDNQLVNVSRFVQDKDIQLVVSILKDKLPEELNNEDNFVVKLSQEEKLFKIEEK